MRYRNTFSKTFFLQTFSVGCLSYGKLFFFLWSALVVQPTNFISSRWQVFGCIDVLKKLCNIHRKTPVLQCILIELQISSLHYKTWIMEETPAQLFSCGFCENFKNAFFYKIAPHDSFCNFNMAEVQFFNLRCIFHQPKNVCVRIRGLKMLVFRRILRTFFMDGPFQWVYQTRQILYHLKVTVKWNIAL